jgi:hypothetical protein
MKSRLILVSLGLAALAILSLGLQAQEQPKTGTQDRDEIITSEQQLMRQFAGFQEALLKLKHRLARGDAKERERAKLLDGVLEECKNLAINQEFTKMIELMRGAKINNTGDLAKVSEQSDTIARKLRIILDKLQDSNANRLSDERKQLQEILKKLGDAITKQQIVENQTKNNKTEPKELGDNQKHVTKVTDNVKNDIDKYLDKDKNDKGGEAANLKGENKDGGKNDGAKGEAKDAGKNKSSEGAKGETKDAGKDSKGAKGETKPGQDKSGQPSKSGDSEPKSASKPGDKGKEGSPPAGAKGDKSDKGEQGASKDNQGDKSDKGKEGAPKDAGSKSGDPMKDSPQGSAKGDDKKPSGGDKSPQGSPPDSKAKSGGGDPMGGGGDQKPPVASKESKGSDKGGEGKAGGDAKGGDGKQGETKSGDSKSGQGQAKDGGASPSPGDPGQPPPVGAKGDSQPPPPGGGDPKNKQNSDVAQSGKKVQEAGYDQKAAEDNIAKQKTAEALKKQADAIAKMEDAKKKLEKLLQQMREEEIERVLAALQARCEKMLMMQQQVLVGTEGVDAAIQKNADKKPTRENKLESQKLSDREKEIVQEANKCIDILEAEGTAVAFPEVFQQIRADMMHVQKRLDLTDVYDVTQGIERDIIDTLKEMIAALKKAREDNQDPGKPGPPGSAGKPADPKLLELIQELKMVRSLQKRVNDRTGLYGKRFPGEQASDPQIVRELRSLADRQQRIQEIVSRIAKGDNK